MSLSNFASWNVRGFNNPLKVGLCKDLIKAHSLKLLAVLEAKIHPSWASDPWFVHSHSLFENEHCCDNFSLASPGRIWIKWDSSQVSFSPSFYSSQIIHGTFSSGSSPPIVLTVIYAANLPEDRKELWDNLLTLSHSINLPWVIMGDFNCCRFESEKVGGVPLVQGRLDELNNCIFDCGLQDLASVGLLFTWYNQRVDLPIHIKLDRILVNSVFMDCFPSSFYKIDPPNGSDHSPIILISKHDEKKFTRFMFKNFWLNQDGFWEILINAFGNPYNASPINAFYKCLRQVKTDIKKKNWSSSSFLSMAILEAKRSQLHLLNEIQCNPLDHGLNSALKYANDNLGRLQDNWSSWIKQRAKAYWLSQGEDDLGFLYAKIRARNNRNNIKEIISPNGILSSHSDIAGAFVDYYSELFNAPPSVVECFGNIPVGEVIPSHLVDSLVAPISDKEIKDVVFAGNSDSSPGPDGFSFAFYQKSWHIIGYYICIAVKHFFTSGCLPKGAKATVITLIPKGSHSSSIADFRPISLCNVFYKIIAKIIANRMKLIMPHIIHESQSGFIANRISTDNIILVTEVLKQYKGHHKFFCAKLDIKKAFDSISRDFLLDRLRRKGFPDLFIKWIRGCISDVYFSICINGSLEGFFKSSSCLRQGCPLSPLLFCIAMDGLSHCLNNNPIASFAGFKHKNLCLSHLMYADDLLVFGEASLSNIACLKDILSYFKDASGLCINPAKSSILFSKAVDNPDVMANSLRISNLEDLFTYLGIPITTQRLKFSHFQPLLSKLSALLEGWKVKFLSFAGRVQYIKFTIANTIAYWIRGAILPKSCQKYISRICSKFLFFGNLTDKKMHMISWKSVTTPKSRGGLGIPSLDSMYHAVSFSFIWRMINTNSLVSWWFKNIYESPWKPPPPSASNFWKLICCKAVGFKNLVSFKVGKDCNYSLYLDPWFYGEPLGSSSVSPSGMGCCVKDVIMNGRWNLPSSWPNNISSRILSIPILDVDNLTWIGPSKPSSKFFSSHFYSSLDKVEWYKYIWHKKHAIRFACYAWMAILGKLKCADSLIRRGLQVNPVCNFCSGLPETHSHLFFWCDFSFGVLTKLLPAANNFFLRPNLFQVYDFMWNHANLAVLEKKFVSLAISAIVYFLWRERNQRRFVDVKKSINQVCEDICLAVCAKVKNWNDYDRLEGKFDEIMVFLG
ncbi:Putative ribonuclease H protein [Dendrobium catenatum]|uniref:Ribonuclease H protein n=1 Tax=Dendrobium catenatum TaxID=906689 RepID=A0A2I0VGM0_9ASPA|nr:Putative ribonuclease H protein [Dendrobium catenatum]